MSEEDIKIYGANWCPDCRRAKEFLGEHRIKYGWFDVERSDEALEYVRRVNKGKMIIPTIQFKDGSILVEPDNAQLAEKLGLQTKAAKSFYDLAIVGGAPAGLTAALYAAREGMDTLFIERSAIGGQAGVTEFIETYPGFPQGVKGEELATLLETHPTRFGVEILNAQSISHIEREDPYLMLSTDSGDEYCSNAILVAPGSNYRRLGVPGEEDFIGAGVHFCATCDGPFYRDKELVVVGGGNSGLQEGLFLTRFASKVTIMEVRDRLVGSRILQEKVLSHPAMNVRLNTTVQEFKGDGRLSSIVVKDLSSGQEEELNPSGVFVFIGLDPNTQFLKGQVELDQWGFIVTKENLETSISGVFAAGDARAGSTKRWRALLERGPQRL